MTALVAGLAEDQPHPPWCARDVHGAHASQEHGHGDIRVQLFQAGTVRALYVGPVSFDPSDGLKVGRLVAALGHPELAAAITALAELAGELAHV